MEHIIAAADNIIREYGGKNVFETAENSGIQLWYRSLGGLKGLYMTELGRRYIVINSGLDNMMKAVVCAHELGHDVLHRILAQGGLRESTLFLACNKTEREANLFAANILISDKEILSELEYTNSVDALCYELNLPSEIIEYKLETLNYKGYNFNVSSVQSDFLK